MKPRIKDKRIREACRIKWREVAVLTLVIGILIIVVIGAILFWVIDKFCPDARLAQLLKVLVVLVCLGAIVNRLLPLLGYPSVL
jgi:formate hydrogenlyase subunit 4